MEIKESLIAQEGIVVNEGLSAFDGLAVGDLEGSGGGSPPGLCPITTLTNLNIGQPQTVVINNAINQVVSTSVGSVSANSLQATSEFYQSTNAQVGQEVVWDGFTGIPGSFGLGTSDNVIPSASPIVGLLVVPAANIIIDINSVGPPITTGGAVLPGYWIHMILDTSNGTATFEDSLGNTGPLTVDPVFNNNNPVYQGSICNASAVIGDTMTVSYNAGWKTFNATNPGGRHCNA